MGKIYKIRDNLPKVGGTIEKWKYIIDVILEIGNFSYLSNLVVLYLSGLVPLKASASRKKRKFSKLFQNVWYVH